MATIKEQLSEELKHAMKAKDVNRRDVIRMIESEVSLAKSAAGFEGEINDDLYRQVIASYSKKMDKARAEYLDLGPRGEEMARKLGWEVDYLSRWLPTKLDQESTQALVRETIGELEPLGAQAAQALAEARFELEFCERFLPKKLDAAATEALVRKLAADNGITDKKQMGRLMGLIMKNHKDEVDGGLVNRLVAAALSES